MGGRAFHASCALRVPDRRAPPLTPCHPATRCGEESRRAPWTLGVLAVSDLGRGAGSARVGKARSLLACAVAAAALGAGLVGCGSDSETASTPGFQEGTTTTDPGPFQMAAPGSTGSTTLPGGPEATDTGTGPTPTTSPPTTTTTLPALPEPGQDPVCQGAISLGNALRSANLGAANPSVPDDLGATFLSTADLLDSSGEAAFQPVVLLLRTIAVEIEGTTDAVLVRERVGALLVPTDPDVAEALQAILDRTEGSCPGLGQGVA